MLECLHKIIDRLVLFDTELFYYKRRERFLKQHGITIDHLPLNFFIGGNMKQVWESVLGDQYDTWDIDKLQQDYSRYKEDNPLPYKDLIFQDCKRVIEKLHHKGYLLGIASSSTRHDIMLALESFNLDTYFKVILSGEEFSESKPNPAIYNRAAELLDIPKQQILIIEDSEKKGITAGIAAGIDVWAIEDKYFGMNQSQANVLVSDLSQFFVKLDNY
ncbi:HAD family hydrolase [Streptococcus agalactiae]|uniref:HAD family hydrolase n=1 Tax=Streptococcus agalactiae TaxID=1311 RepID=UPI00085BD2A3|nr:HAD family phosphatase [Streptococcus agalactiae]